MSEAPYAVVFPGREAFSKGLDRSFYEQYAVFRTLYERASDSLQEDLYRISFEAPEERPDLHTVCLIAYCYAIAAIGKENGMKPTAAAGFSQGEFTAAAFAGILDYPDVLHLVYRLEALLLDNPAQVKGRMARIVELDREQLAQCCRSVDPDNNEVSIAIHLSTDQNIISGTVGRVEDVCRLAKASGARWAITLAGEGAFHSPLCEPIVVLSKPVFDHYRFHDTHLPVYSCTDGRSSRNGEEVRGRLSRQIAMPVLWDNIVHSLRETGIKQVVELGPGCTVSGNSRLICPELDYIWINHPDELISLRNRLI